MHMVSRSKGDFTLRKLLFGLLVLVVVVVGGLWYGKKIMTNVLSGKMAVVLNSPSGKQVLNQVLKSKGVKDALETIGSNKAGHSAISGLKTVGTSAKNNLHFAKEQQAIQFALSRVSAAQLLTWANDYRNRSTLSEAQKKEIESQVLSKFSVNQLQAMAGTIGK